MSIKIKQPKAINRRRIYDTVAGVLAVAVVWGVIDAGDAAAISDSLVELVGIATALLARFNVDTSE